MEGFAQLAVLVVDGQPGQRAAARQVLQTLGVQQILAACDGREALDLLRLCQFDLVLCDMALPGMDGPELIQQIRLHDGRPPERQAPVWAWVGERDGPLLESHTSLAEAMGLAHAHGLCGPLRPEHVLPLLYEAATRDGEITPLGLARPPVFSDDALAALVHDTPGQIEVVLQPQHDLVTDRVVGAEALCRWLHPVHGRILPTAFVPRLEALGLADALFFHVLGHCVRVQRALAAQSIALPIGVNASAQTLSREGAIERIAGVVGDACIDPACIVVELSDDAPVAESARLAVALHQLRQLGHGLAIDDFGVGFAVLKLLAELPFTILKIDRSLTEAVSLSSQRGIVCRTMIELAGALRLQCVAEGVETDAQRRALLTLGCATGQGYLWAAPLSTTAFLARVQAE
ncbi:EAL domain-containing protein [Ralstonia solanacearum]|uniref:EAL domain-containing response regulator n=1 Tax=Ralstonia solanacearum TaxID=305 RepID=UPI002029D9FA|nr:EAL domain-containing response regulator [Ralstonia solanacearum]MCL9845697.1 EAL domain-containing protein [Ralstonia solanacearum]MDC6256256.1 EAL domain-containing response regulator [Ralstonia solanacearum]MDC6260914.1 EAL domain-containing response regulator [Ralstonia solanacearum]MDC6305561.1 EAL domain-containing response regulator [Ralstonia solanacearum]